MEVSCRKTSPTSLIKVHLPVQHNYNVGVVSPDTAKGLAKEGHWLRGMASPGVTRVHTVPCWLLSYMLLPSCTGLNCYSHYVFIGHHNPHP